MKKISRRLCAGILALVVAVSVGAPISTQAAKVTVSSVKVAAPYAKNVSVVKGKSIKLSAVVKATPNKKANKKVTYKSANSRIASVNKNGVVKGINIGSTKVTVTSVKDKSKSATIKVKVVDKAVTKVKLNKTKATILSNQTLALKATVKPAKASNKKLFWTSSDESIATVDNKGNVKAVKAGTVVIKATTTDGSNKSAKCTLTINQTSDLIAVKALDNTTLGLTLNKATDIKVADIKVYSKQTYEGRYVTEHAVAAVNTNDQINYILSLGKDEYISENGYVKVVISSLNGNQSFATKIEFPIDSAPVSDVVITSKVNEAIEKTLVDLSDKLRGNATYNVEGLPAGFYTVTKNGELYVCGKSAVVLDNVLATVNAEDELGNKATVKIRFLIGNDTTYVYYYEPITVLANLVNSYSSTIYCAGGVGNSVLSLVNVEGLNKQFPGITIQIIQNSSMPECATIVFDYGTVDNAGKKSPAILTNGTHSFNINICDSMSALVKEVPFVVECKTGATLTGILTDAMGQPIVGRKVYAYCTSKAYSGLYSDYLFESINETDSTGKYTINVIGDEEYYIAGCGAVAWDVKVPAAGANINLKSPYYRVNFVLPVEKATKVVGEVRNYDTLNADKLHEYTYSRLYDIYDSAYNSYSTSYELINGVGYFLPGKYHLVHNSKSEYAFDAYTDNGIWLGKYCADAEFSVENNNITVTAKMTKTDNE